MISNQELLTNEIATYTLISNILLSPLYEIQFFLLYQSHSIDETLGRNTHHQKRFEHHCRIQRRKFH